jgi:hypothetical protein
VSANCEIDDAKIFILRRADIVVERPDADIALAEFLSKAALFGAYRLEAQTRFPTRFQ